MMVPDSIAAGQFRLIADCLARVQRLLASRTDARAAPAWMGEESLSPLKRIGDERSVF